MLRYFLRFPFWYRFWKQRPGQSKTILRFADDFGCDFGMKDAAVLNVAWCCIVGSGLLLLMGCNPRTPGWPNQGSFQRVQW